jgi:ABC-type nitrate/sulfonate/bicarbonate transport system substrate-binding protein
MCGQRAFLMAAVLVLCSVTVAAAAPEKVRLNIKWYHQFQFAGYYAAQKMGYYRDAGLEVEIAEPRNDRYPVETVLAGEAEYGVSAADLVPARVAGKPVVVLAVIFQHSPIVLLSRRDANLRYPSDYVGRTVIAAYDDGAEIMAMFLREGVDTSGIKFVFRADWIDALRMGEVDGSIQYLTDQPFQLRRAGIEPGIMKPVDYGIDFYADSLFTTEQEIRRHPERAAAFRRASIRGWEYALDHVDEMIDHILTLPGVKERGLDRAHLLYEAGQTINLIQPTLVEPGHVNPERWERMAQTFADLSMIPPDYTLDGFIFEEQNRYRYVVLFRILAALSTLLALGAGGVLVWNGSSAVLCSGILPSLRRVLHICRMCLMR